MRKKKKRRSIVIAVVCVIVTAAASAAVLGYQWYKGKADAGTSGQETTATVDMDVGKTILTSDQKETLEDIKAVYNEENQEEIQ